MRDELLRLLDMTRDVYTDRSGNAALEKVRAGLRALAAQCGEPSAPPAQPVALPPGWVAVPREPTLEMLLAEDAAIPSRDEDDDAFAWGRVGWAAMLAAAPKPEEIADFRCADGRKSGCQCIPEIGCNSASAPEVPRG